MDSNLRYCCNLKCFVKRGTEVDGIACKRCMSSCRCYCKCKTYMKNIYPKKMEEINKINHCATCRCNEKKKVSNFNNLQEKIKKMFGLLSD